MEGIKILQVGLGPLGQKVTRYIAERSGVRVVGAVDRADDKVGQDLGGLCGLSRTPGVVVQRDVRSAIRGERPDVAIVTTVSKMPEIAPQLEELIEFGIPVVSSCEELVFPWAQYPELSQRIDDLARRRGIAIVGTGVNPGFVMDYLPVVITGVCQRVEKIRVCRYQDASSRRIPFQKKIGVGMPVDQFSQHMRNGTMGHVGLPESVHVIAHSLGWTLDRFEEQFTPLVADGKSGVPGYAPGTVIGVQQVARGFAGDAEVVTLDFKAWIGEEDPRDSVEVTGEPNMTMRIDGGVHGDIATCAIMINAARSVLRAAPGLKTMLDIPAVSSFR